MFEIIRKQNMRNLLTLQSSAQFFWAAPTELERSRLKPPPTRPGILYDAQVFHGRCARGQKHSREMGGSFAKNMALTHCRKVRFCSSHLMAPRTKFHVIFRRCWTPDSPFVCCNTSKLWNKRSPHGVGDRSINQSEFLLLHNRELGGDVRGVGCCPPLQLKILQGNPYLVMFLKNRPSLSKQQLMYLPGLYACILFYDKWSILLVSDFSNSPNLHTNQLLCHQLTWSQPN